MSLIGAAEQAAETAVGAAIPGLGWARLALKFAPYIVIALLAGALLLTRARLDAVRQADKLAEQTRRADAEEQKAAWADGIAHAAQDYAQRLSDRQPIILHSKDTVTQYAQTPAGRVPCLAADRVHGIDQLDEGLAAAARHVAGPVPDPASAPAK
jgi:hypothetical protein